MTEKHRREWTFASPDDDEHTRPDHVPDEVIPEIGHDDPTVRTTALPDTGVDSAVHDVSQVLRRAHHAS